MSVTQVTLAPPTLYLRTDPLSQKIHTLLIEMRNQGVQIDALTDWEEAFEATKNRDEINFLLGVLVTEFIEPLIVENPTLWLDFREKVTHLFQNLPEGMETEKWIELCAERADQAKVQQETNAFLENSMRKIARDVRTTAQTLFASLQKRSIALVNEQTKNKTRANETAETIQAITFDSENLENLAKEIEAISQTFENLVKKHT